MKYSTVISTVLLLMSCENKIIKDPTPPEITITFPQNGSIVNEIVTITCISTDSEGVEKVELWVDEDSTGITDETEPYSLEWNTTTYEDGSYTITIRSYDSNGNTIDSNPITLFVDNSGLNPTSVELYPIIYSDSSFTITWSQNSEEDFHSYSVFSSLSNGADDSVIVFYSDNRLDTAATFNYNQNCQVEYFSVVVTDILGLTSQSQEIPVISSQLTFNTEMENQNLLHRATHVLEYSNEGYYLLGDWRPGQFVDYEQIKLIKINSSGNIQWINNIASWMWANPTSLTITQSRELVVTSNEGADMGFGQGAMLQKLDIYGSSIWIVDFTAQAVTRFIFDQIITANGDIVCVGVKNDDRWDANIVYDLWVIKYDINGNEVWNNTYTSPDSNHFYEYGKSVVETSNGDLLITCSSRGPYSSNEGDFILFKLDSYGNKIWSKILLRNCMPYDIIFNEDNSYTIIGEYNLNIFVMKVSNDGEVVWSLSFGSSLHDRNPSIIKTDDSYVIAYNSMTHVPSSFTLLKISLDGTVEWTKTYNPENQTQPFINEIIMTNDGGYVIAGSNGGNAWLIKTDCNGNFVQ